MFGVGWNWGNNSKCGHLMILSPQFLPGFFAPCYFGQFVESELFADCFQMHSFVIVQIDRKTEKPKGLCKSTHGRNMLKVNLLGTRLR